MSKYIGWALLILVVIMIVEINVCCAMLSEQHVEFLKLMFWEFPIAIIEAWVPGI